MKGAYRRQCGLLSVDEIVSIRKKYSISQKDLANVLGWGEKTITRYEGHQVQDVAYDLILRKISDDPLWLLELLEQRKQKLSLEGYEKCRLAVINQISLVKIKYQHKIDEIESLLRKM